MARELHHVISAAVFRGIGAQFFREFAGICSPTLTIAGAAGAIAPLAGHFIPEILSDVAIPRFTGQLVTSRGPDNFWNLRVHMQSLQFVTMRSQRIKELRVL